MKTKWERGDKGKIAREAGIGSSYLCDIMRRRKLCPADYMETVNTPGQRLYAKQWKMDNDKGVNLEFQSNVLHYCTRPRVLIRAKRT